jgi:hypothetical protein
MAPKRVPTATGTAFSSHASPLRKPTRTTGMNSKQKENDPVIGLPINKYYTIDSFLGEGAFGKVYAIKDHCTADIKSDNTLWACKVVPHINTTTTTTAPPTKPTKSKKKNTTTPADRLHYEFLMYTQQFRNLCGTILPLLPNYPHHKLNCFYPNIINTGTFILYI